MRHSRNPSHSRHSERLPESTDLLYRILAVILLMASRKSHHTNATHNAPNETLKKGSYIGRVDSLTAHVSPHLANQRAGFSLVAPFDAIGEELRKAYIGYFHQPAPFL